MKQAQPTQPSSKMRFQISKSGTARLDIWYLMASDDLSRGLPLRKYRMAKSWTPNSLYFFFLFTHKINSTRTATGMLAAINIPKKLAGARIDRSTRLHSSHS